MFERIREIIMEQLNITDESLITMDTTLEDLGVDSLDIAEVIMAIEDEMDVQIRDEDLENLKKVSDLVDYITVK